MERVEPKRDPRRTGTEGSLTSEVSRCRLNLAVRSLVLGRITGEEPGDGFPLPPLDHERLLRLVGGEAVGGPDPRTSRVRPPSTSWMRWNSPAVRPACGNVHEINHARTTRCGAGPPIAA
jgi:hypothetical protein